MAGQSESRRDQRHAFEKTATVDGDMERFRFGFVRFKFHSSHFLCYRPHSTRSPIKAELRRGKTFQKRE
jgi:hypothetical protein